jgi:hypothetical protein
MSPKEREFGKHEPDCPNAELPSVRSEPLLAVYSRFKHLDSVFQMVGDSDGSDNTDPVHATTRDLWLAIKESLGISANTGNEAR